MIAAPPPPQLSAYILAITGGGLGVFPDRKVLFVRQAQGWSVEDTDRSRHIKEETHVDRWTDEAHCPGLVVRIGELARLPPQTSPAIPPFDGNWITLTAREDGRERRLQADWRGPLLDWWAATEKLLADCWRAHP